MDSRCPICDNFGGYGMDKWIRCEVCDENRSSLLANYASSPQAVFYGPSRTGMSSVNQFEQLSEWFKEDES